MVSGMKKITRVDVIDNYTPGRAVIAMYDVDAGDRRVLMFPHGNQYVFYPQYTSPGNPVWRYYRSTSGYGTNNTVYMLELQDAIRYTAFSDYE